MQVFTTVPLTDLATAGGLFAELEEVGYDGAFSYETNHDPFLPLALAATTTSHLRLGTSIAIAFARTPMLLANVGWDLQDVSRGRFTLGLGSQIRPHIEKRYSMPWSRPAARMHELVRAIHAIWSHWDGVADLDFRGEFSTSTPTTPVFVPGAAPVRAFPDRRGRASGRPYDLGWPARSPTGSSPIPSTTADVVARAVRGPRWTPGWTRAGRLA